MNKGFGSRAFRRRGAATIEYATVIIFVLVAFLGMRKYFLNAMSGKWKATGETLGVGRQYDPRNIGVGHGGTIECFYEPAVNKWVNRKKAEMTCDCSDMNDACLTCLTSCGDSCN